MPEETNRLDSWKQIAAYLQKSERTVRRWHDTEGLPVHKHQHQQRGSVWTYAGEIDEWLELRRVRPAPPVAAESELIEAPSRRRRMWLGMLGAVLAACGGAFWSISLAPPVARLAHPVALTSLPGMEYGAAFSPDGKQIAFFWSGPSREASGIYTKTLGSESVTPLILSGPGHQFVYGPTWSPDGRTIAFLRRTETTETWLCLVASSGGLEKRLIRLQDKTAVFFADNSHLAWSLDGRRILAPFQMGERKQAIHWITAASGAVQRITEPSASDDAPVASPDRKSLVFLRHLNSPGGGQELLLQKLKPDGSADGTARLLMRGAGLISGVAWAPGGADVIVCKREPGTAITGLFRMPARPGGRLISIGGEGCSGVEVSRADEKGRAKLVYGSNREPNAQLWTADLKDLEHGSSFAPSSRSDTFPAFSPDGTSVVFRSTRGGAPAAWIANQDGTQLRRLSDLEPFYGIEWSPDGSQILFGSVGQGLAIVPLTGGTPAVIAAGGVPAWPHWSHGSGLIYYVAAQRLFQIRPDGSGRAPVGEHWSQPLSNVQVVRTSPDGKTLFISRGLGLFRRPATAEGVEELIEPNLLSISIAATPTTLYYLRREDKALYGLSFAGGPPKKSGILHPFDEGNPNSVMFTVSKDDRRIVWAVGGSTEVDLELVADFR